MNRTKKGPDAARWGEGVGGQEASRTGYGLRESCGHGLNPQVVVSGVFVALMKAVVVLPSDRGAKGHSDHDAETKEAEGADDHANAQRAHWSLAGAGVEW